MKPIDLAKYKDLAPFSQLLVKNQDLLNVFRKVQINIPLLCAINHIPAYARFLKDLCTKKNKFKHHEQIVLSREVGFIFHNSLPPKLDNSRCFTVPCTIEDRRFECALLIWGRRLTLCHMRPMRI